MPWRSRSRSASSIGRGFFALGRDGLLPSVFAKMSRYDTPWVGNLVVAFGGLGLIVLVGLTDYASRFPLETPDGVVPPSPTTSSRRSS